MNRDGFTLVEVIVGMMVFAVGVLALTATMGFVSLQLQAADVRTERSVAVQQATEYLYTMDFDAVETKAGADALPFGDYAVWWDVEDLSWSLKEVSVYSQGVSFREQGRREGVLDTLVFRIARPFE